MSTFLRTLHPRQLEHKICLSLFIYALGVFLYTAASTTIGNAVQLIGALYFLKQCVQAHKGISTLPFPKLLLNFIALWTLILVARMFLIDKNIIITLPFQKAIMEFFLGYKVWPIFLVFIPYIFGKRYNFDLGYFVEISVLMAVIFLTLSPFAFHNMLNFQFTMYGEEGENYQDFISSSTLGVPSLCPCIIVLFWKKYIPKKVWTIVLIACIINLLMTMYLARRGNTVLTLVYFFMIWYLYTASGKVSKKLKMIAFGLLLILVGYIIFKQYADSFFSLLIERGDTDTRGGVEQNFYKDFNSWSDWIFGRGLLGTYYDKIFHEYRSSIETGYLFLSLRGGLLYLIPYVVLLIISGIRGYFKGKNLFVKSVAILMLMSVFELYPWGYPTFSFKFFIIWLGVYICNSQHFLFMSDLEVQTNLFRLYTKKKI